MFQILGYPIVEKMADTGLAKDRDSVGRLCTSERPLFGNRHLDFAFGCSTLEANICKTGVGLILVHNILYCLGMVALAVSSLLQPVSIP
jgi:hypothetical protein